MNRIILISLVLFFMVSSVCGENSKKDIQSLVKNLGSDDPIARNIAIEKLSLQGEEVVAILMEKFAQDNYIIRREKTEILGRIGTESVLQPLLSILKDNDAGVRNIAACMLLDLSDRFPLVDHLKNMRVTSPQIRATIEDLKNSIVYKEVEQELLYYVSPDGSSGYFTGQFSKLQAKWKSEAIPPLLEIFSDADYQYVNQKINNDRDTSLQMRFLAGEGLADLKNVYTPKLRLRVRLALGKMAREKNNQLGTYITGLINKILYKIGYTQGFDRELRLLKSRLRFNPNNRDVLFDIGMKYLQIGDTKNGILYLNKAVAVSPEDGITYYNLACAYSVAGRVDDAMSALEKSVFYGYRDLDWMLKDGDLRNVRKHPRFEKLVKQIEELRKKEKNG